MKNTGTQLAGIERTSDIDVLAETGSSNPALIEYYNVDVREFVVLASLYEEGEMDAHCIAIKVGISPTTTHYVLESLGENGLVRATQASPECYLPTEDGRALIRKSRNPGHQ